MAYNTEVVDAAVSFGTWKDVKLGMVEVTTVAQTTSTRNGSESTNPPV